MYLMYFWSIFRIDKTAKLDIFKVLEQNHSKMNKVISFAVQLSVLILFQKLHIKIDAVYGKGFGKLVAGFYYKLITLEEAVSRALIFTKKKLGKQLDGNADFITDLQLPQTEKILEQNTKIGKERDDFFTREELSKTIKNSITLNISDMTQSANDIKLTDLNSFLEVLGRYEFLELITESN